MPNRRLLINAVVIAIPFLGAAFMLADRIDVVATLHGLIESRALSGSTGFALLLAAQTLIAASGVLPASIVGIAAGMLCGTIGGFSMAAFCTILGAFLTFLVARHVAGQAPPVSPKRRSYLDALDRLVTRDGWRFVCLLRLSPVMPFAATSYMLGISRVSLRDYMIGTCASLPALAGFVLTGVFVNQVGTSWRSGLGGLSMLLTGLGVTATLILTIKIGRVAGLALKERHLPRHHSA